jgi:hypothetical protein
MLDYLDGLEQRNGAPPSWSWWPSPSPASNSNPWTTWPRPSATDPAALLDAAEIEALEGLDGGS